MSSHLIKKYNIPGPRYTSYPTVPYWDEGGISKADWVETFQKSFNESNDTEGISLYIHIPFCERICTFCGCHKRLGQKGGDIELPYVNAVIKEWSLYCNLLPEKPMVKEIHIGGGTPTFCTAKTLTKLIQGILDLSEKAESVEFGFEGHPNSTEESHLKALYDLGFRRVSFGVQDYNEKVQKTINRIQPFGTVEKVTQTARRVGYTSINHDLIYGLPFQTLDSVVDSIEKTKLLIPDRIAFYSYAHVPWIRGNAQRGFDESNLPKNEDKRKLYEEGKRMFLEAGYIEIGMDHFSLPSDKLYQSVQDKTIHRNFMGYTSSKTQLMIGLGVSSISDSWYSFAQNEKSMRAYYDFIKDGELPIVKGHLLTTEDLIVRKHILNMMCEFTTSWKDNTMKFEKLDQSLIRLQEMVKDGLININEDGLKIREMGKPFIRNICMAFDIKLMRKEPTTRIFSMTI